MATYHHDTADRPPAARTIGAAHSASIEWRTVLLILACYAAWLAGGWLYRIDGAVAIVVLALAIALHSSLQHEAIHRHPTRSQRWNEALVFLPLGLLVPYRRYRDLHLDHHAADRLTDPRVDPESFYLTPDDYRRLPRVLRGLLAWNNVLAVRLLTGPLITAAAFVLAELREGLRARGAEARSRRRAWGLHAIGVIVVAGLAHVMLGVPIGVYLLATYLGQSLLALRSFCEHQWADARDNRTVIVERSLLGLLFLNNNLHLVHHKHPALPWYELPHAYRARRAEWQAMNGGYVFAGYRAVIGRFAFQAKEPVAHPARAG